MVHVFTFMRDKRKDGADYYNLEVYSIDYLQIMV